MTPVIKPGWNLYNCNPPPGRIRYSKRSKPGVASSCSVTSKSLKNPSTPDSKPNNACPKRRRSLPPSDSTDQNAGFCRNPNPRLGAPLKLVHVKPTLYGHYRLTSFSTDSLRMRNLDVTMQAIPEEDDDDSEGGSDCGSDGDANLGLMASNPELATIPSPPPQDSHMYAAHGLFTRFRTMFRLSWATLPAPFRADHTNGSNASSARLRTLPNFIRNLQRRRS